MDTESGENREIIGKESVGFLPIYTDIEFFLRKINWKTPMNREVVLYKDTNTTLIEMGNIEFEVSKFNI